MTLYVWCAMVDGVDKPMTLEWDGSSNRPMAMAFRTEDEARIYTNLAVAAGDICGWPISLREFEVTGEPLPF